jgi:hypothetical protein
MKTCLRIVAAFIVVLAIAAPVAVAQDSPSAPAVQPGIASATAFASQSAAPSPSAAAAATLTALLDVRKLDAVASRDPDQPGNFVAALYFPGSQLLVVSGPYAQPALLDRRIAAGDYREVYLDLNSALSHEGQFFVMDLLADGLRPACERDQPFDSTTRNGANQVEFDGNWTRQQLTEKAYDARFTQDDTRYAHLLGALAGVLRRSMTTAANVGKD